MSSNIKYIIGTGNLLDYTVDAWREVEPETDLRPLHLDQDDSYQFDLSILDDLAAENVTAFAIFDSQFLNFRRYELMGALKARGFKMPPLISKGAVIARTASIAENVMVGTAAIIGHRCEIGFNSVIGAAANIGAGSKIGHSVWIESSVIMGQSVEIGNNSSIGFGVILDDKIKVGKLCVVDIPGKIESDVNTKTFLHANFDTPLEIVDVVTNRSIT